jgi:transcriptional regulator with XRE-family HTH domain
MNISLNHVDQSSDEVVDVLQVGNRVKQARQAAGYSIEDLAVTCGLTSDEITRIEDGFEIDMQHLKRIAPALQTTVSSLIEGTA